MSEILKVKVQDENGNVFYIHTSADVVFCADGTSVQDRLGQKLDKSAIIQNATTAATDKVPSAAVAKNLQDQITQQNTNMIGKNQTTYVTFSEYGDYWWVSSPIPCPGAEKMTILLSGNVKNSSENNKSEIGRDLFGIMKYKNHFVLRTNNRDVAGHIFKNVHPGIVWDITYDVYK